MDSAMLGVGVGFDTKGAGLPVHGPDHSSTVMYTIPDSREGWVESVRRVLDSYLEEGKTSVAMDYSLIRGAGTMPLDFRTCVCVCVYVHTSPLMRAY
jgi:hypothetical protein